MLDVMLKIDNLVAKAYQYGITVYSVSLSTKIYDELLRHMNKNALFMNGYSGTTGHKAIQLYTIIGCVNVSAHTDATTKDIEIYDEWGLALSDKLQYYADCQEFAALLDHTINA